jgi:hypothetical protein
MRRAVAVTRGRAQLDDARLAGTIEVQLGAAVDAHGCGSGGADADLTMPARRHGIRRRRHLVFLVERDVEARAQPDNAPRRARGATGLEVEERARAARTHGDRGEVALDLAGASGRVPGHAHIAPPRVIGPARRTRRGTTTDRRGDGQLRERVFGDPVERSTRCKRGDVEVARVRSVGQEHAERLGHEESRTAAARVRARVREVQLEADVAARRAQAPRHIRRIERGGGAHGSRGSTARHASASALRCRRRDCVRPFMGGLLVRVG